jgi:hypothetical protein
MAMSEEQPSEQVVVTLAPEQLTQRQRLPLAATYQPSMLWQQQQEAAVSQ